MPILLPRSYQNQQKRKKEKQGRPIRPSRGVRKRYEDALLGLTKNLKAQTSILSAVFADGGTQAQLMTEARRLYRIAQNEFDNASDALANSFVDDTTTEHKERYDNMVKAALGVEFASIIDGNDMVEALNKAVAENVGLIESVPQEQHTKVQKAIRDHFNGDLQTTLPKRLQQIGGITDRRAKFIARDQIASLTGDITEIRNKEAGMGRYVWRNQQDRRVVGNPSGLYPKGNRRHMDHWHREGKEFSWDKPPRDGHPGKAINCRCFSTPIIDVDELNAVYV